MIETILQVGYIIHAADKQASANTKHTWATAHVCPRALQLAPTLPPPFLPPCTAARSPRAAANPIWPRTLALSVPKVQYGFLAPSVPKKLPNLHGSVDTTTSLLHCPTRWTVSVCARARYVKNVLRLHFWGVDRPALASDKTVKDLLHGCKQFCSLEN